MPQDFGLEKQYLQQILQAIKHSVEKVLKFFQDGSLLLSMNDFISSVTETKSDFDRAMAELDEAIAKFQASVDECCEAIKTFKANL